MVLLEPFWRLLGLARWGRSLFVTPPSVVAAREALLALPELKNELVVIRNTLLVIRHDTEAIAVQTAGVDRSVHQLLAIAEPLEATALRVARVNDRLVRYGGLRSGGARAGPGLTTPQPPAPTGPPAGPRTPTQR